MRKSNKKRIKQGLSLFFYFSKVQLVSRLPLFAIRSALAHVKIQKQKKNLLTGVRFYEHMSQWPACGGSSSLGALFTLKPCTNHTQLAKIYQIKTGTDLGFKQNSP